MGLFSDIKNSRMRTAGFTLIELMMVLFILSILLGILYQIWMSNERATRMLDSKVKMRDEARLGMSHIVRNLRMANFGTMSYIDENDVNQVWPPPAPPNAGSLVRGIVFTRPVDLDGDGNPYAGNNMAVDWSGAVTIRVDTNDINGDGITGQVVQLLNGAFIKVLINDIAPANRDSSGTIYDTPGAGGFWFSAPEALPSQLVQISMVQQRNLVTVPGFVVNYYEEFVRVRN